MKTAKTFRSAVLLREAHDDFCGSNCDFVHFYLPAYDKTSAPLNRVLLDETARAIWSGSATIRYATLPSTSI